MDCYKVLRLPPNALPEEIEEATQILLTIWNPFDYDDDFKEVALCVVDDIKKAKRILTDPVMRKQHDEQLKLNTSKMDERSRIRRVEVISDAGLNGFYCRPWISPSYGILGKHGVNRSDNLEWEGLHLFHHENANYHPASEFNEAFTMKTSIASKTSSPEQFISTSANMMQCRQSAFSM
ncbi:uncharacterized protein TNCV_1467971 [Trichonephila clavipes]|uniref:J domain-containing protein n=1 Tax=Trichonephila clavipes TaxID=2585209 RepID=A0A8X6S4F9_TRICX|nr:uncharacterized protein TNCV_1467971 [Trichonephila clavipes]